MYNFTHFKNLTGKLDPFWKVRMRALEHLKDVYIQCSVADRQHIQQQIAGRIVNEKVHPVVLTLEDFRDNEATWTQLMRPTLQQVNKQKKQLQTEHNVTEDKAKKAVGTQKSYESNGPEEEQKELTVEQQLLLFELALQEENIKTEEMKIKSFMPKK